MQIPDKKFTTPPLDEVWNMTLEMLKPDYSDALMDLWFNKLQLYRLDGHNAYLLCDSGYRRDVITERFKSIIEKNLSAILGYDVEVTVVSSDDDRKYDIQSSSDAKSNSDADSKASDGVKTIQNAELFEDENEFPENDSPVKLGYSPDYTFETFIVGNSNKFAHAACTAVANNPAREYNPLFIYGPSGLGKTHLLYAITYKIMQKNSKAKIKYVKGEEFTNQMIESIAKGTAAQFRDTYRKVDVLLIDDIQFIAGRESTQEEFFHTFNTLYEDHKQIILTSDRPPKEIKTLEDRLKTRFEWGLIADVQPPDFELRTAIMKNKAEKIGITIPNDVLDVLAENLRSNVRQLEGAVKKIGAQCFLNNMPITIELAKSCISDLTTGSEPVSVTVDKIFEKVAKKYGITVEDLKGKKRNREIANPRHICIYIIRKVTDMSFPAIAKFFGRDHSTIISSVTNIESELKGNSLLEIEINDLIKEIKE